MTKHCSACSTQLISWNPINQSNRILYIIEIPGALKYSAIQAWVWHTHFPVTNVSCPSVCEIIPTLAKLCATDSLFVSISNSMGLETWRWDSPAMDNNRAYCVALGLGCLSHKGQYGQRVLWHSHVRPLSVVVLGDHAPTGSSFLGTLEETRQLIS